MPGLYDQARKISFATSGHQGIDVQAHRFEHTLSLTLSVSQQGHSSHRKRHRLVLRHSGSKSRTNNVGTRLGPTNSSPAHDPLRSIADDKIGARCAREFSTESIATQSRCLHFHRMTKTEAPIGARLTCTVRDACSFASIGRTKLYQLISEGRLATTTIGRRRLIVVSSLKTLLGADTAIAVGG
jgi:excisionase family DNA binding protein